MSNLNNEAHNQNMKCSEVCERPDFESELFKDIYSDAELIIGLVGAVGTDLDEISKILKNRLKAYSYDTEEIRVSKDIIKESIDIEDYNDEFGRISSYMNGGNRIRKESRYNSALALGIASKLHQLRKQNGNESEPFKKKAIIINSLKHPDEVQRLRQIYSIGFYLIGVYKQDRLRKQFLIENLKMNDSQADEIMARDSDESEPFGQHTRDTFHLSDFFVNCDKANSIKLQNDIWRFLDLIFGNPYITPTFDEYAMFMAFSASLRSADLSRQVGAVIALNKNIIATGANDVPCAGGGLYWPCYDKEEAKIIDIENGRDYKRGIDSNASEKQSLIENILSKLPIIPKNQYDKYRCRLEGSNIDDITEYGRIVHAEMEAILSCARSQSGIKDAELYCTTYPCHNCAKHIIAAGIKRVIYVEPYPKSKAMKFHYDSISNNQGDSPKVIFEPFVGVGPRSFFNLFSMRMGIGYYLKRKNKYGKIINWQESDGRLRMQLLPHSYLEREVRIVSEFKTILERLNEEK